VPFALGFTLGDVREGSDATAKDVVDPSLRLADCSQQPLTAAKLGAVNSSMIVVVGIWRGVPARRVISHLEFVPATAPHTVPRLKLVVLIGVRA
jgi:hypothetical protein